MTEDKSQVYMRRVFEVLDDRWVLEVEFDGQALSFELKERDKPDSQYGGRIDRVDANEFLTALTKITESDEPL